MTSSRSVRALVAASSTLAVMGAGLVATAAAAQADDTSTTLCPGTPVLTRTLTSADAGLQVTGHTTTSLSGQDTFTGKLIGTQTDSFGGTVYLFDLKGSRITHSDGSIDAGIWAGISGSPVYDDTTGALIGSVSYGFTSQDAETIAGITPAPEIFASDKTQLTAPTVTLSSTNVKRVQTAAAKTAAKPSAAAVHKMTALALPKVTAGDADAATDIASHSKALQKKTGVKTTFGTAGVQDVEDTTPTAGDPIATSWSYGDLPMAAVGTITAVCGDKIFAYGHPDENIGASTQTLLPASINTIHADGAWSYVDANIGSTPIGQLTNDRPHGVVGVLGAAPAGASVTTSTTVGSDAAVTHSSTVTSPYALSSVVGDQVYGEVIEALDQDAAGSAKATWTIGYTVNGVAHAPFTRTQAFADDSYLSDDLAYTVAGDIETLQYGSTSKVAITSVNVATTATPDYRAYRISGADVKVGSKWVTYGNGKTISAKKGSKLTVRLHLAPAGDSVVEPTTQQVVTTLPKSSYVTPSLSFLGQQYSDDFYFDDEDDDEGDDEDYYYDDGTESLSQLLSDLASQPRADSILRSLTYYTSTGRHVSTSKTQLTDVVGGYYHLSVKLK